MNIIKTLGCKITEHAPEISLAAGITLGVATVILACKGKPEADEVTTNGVEVVTTIKEEASKATDPQQKKEYTKDLMMAYKNVGVGIAKAYGPAALSGLGSLLCVLYSYGVLKKRNTELMASCAALTSGFMKYKKRVAERFGEEVEREIAIGSKKEKVKVVKTDEFGNEEVVKEPCYTQADPCDPYTFLMTEETSDAWSRNPDVTLLYIKSAIEQETRDFERAKGNTVFVNDFLKRLAFENRPLSGQLTGFVNDENCPGIRVANTEVDDIPDANILITPIKNAVDVANKARNPRIEYLIQFKPTHMFTMNGKKMEL